MKNLKWLWLQLFNGDGAGGEGGDGAATGGNAVVPGQQRLLELGVPADKIRKRAKHSTVTPPPGSVRDMTPKTATNDGKEQKKTEQDAAADNPTEVKTEEQKTRLSWEEIKADPEYHKEYDKETQAIVKSRLRSAKSAEEDLAKLTPALEVLARKYKQDPQKMDYEALAKAISDDRDYYEDKALEMGVSVETAMQIDKQERDTAREQRDRQKTLEQQKFQQYIMGLEQQGEAMKKVFPNFDLRKELENPVFARMTSPNVGISVEDAYHAVHRKEIQEAAMQVTAQKTAQAISNSIKSGSYRPNENGTSGQAPSVTSFDYRAASKEQREALKKYIRSEAAQGRKVFPGSGK